MDLCGPVHRRQLAGRRTVTVPGIITARRPVPDVRAIFFLLQLAHAGGSDDNGVCMLSDTDELRHLAMVVMDKQVLGPFLGDYVRRMQRSVGEEPSAAGEISPRRPALTPTQVAAELVHRADKLDSANLAARSPASRCAPRDVGPRPDSPDAKAPPTPE